MTEAVKPLLFIFLFFAIPGVIGGIMASNRGRNVFGWTILSAIFPFFIMVLYFNKPLREVPGKFRKCRACGEYYPWKLTSCRYCATPPDAPPPPPPGS